MPKKFKKTIRMKLRLKDCEKVFDEELGPGVLVSQEMVYTLPEDYSKVMFAKQVMDDEHDFIERYVEVQIEEVPNGG